MKPLLRAFVMCIAALVVGGALPVFTQESAGGVLVQIAETECTRDSPRPVSCGE